ncbi:Glycosyl hydrolase family 10 protein [Forsythia ovata]|uniref:Glycosyl hydrolase family 10 protein n=1 Tax=Forsythia ovata TaxID=205694 RepID=A0ABD1QMB7_9LAMI
MFKTQTGNEIAGWVMAQNGCWSMLKGGIVVNASGPAHLYFEVRKSKVKFQAVDQHNQPLPNATITIKQNRPNFPLGCTINPLILSNTWFQNWFTSRFRYTVFENELKWYVNEPSRGKENYDDADALLKFAKANNVQVRGHNILWDGVQLLPNWVGELSTNDLWKITQKRINSIVKRYVGQMIHWDVMNENLHYSFFESKLGSKASTIVYQKVNKIDGKSTLFLNDYNTIETTRDADASAAKYLAKISQIRQEGYNGPLGIGLEGHFNSPNLPYIRATLDQLATAKLPIWLTELDVHSGHNQALYLDQILREAHAHPGVEGIMIWAPWTPTGCYRMCLTDNNFKNLATGDVVDNILSEWKLAGGLKGATDSNGYFETSLFHGEYEAQISHPSLLSKSTYKLKRFNVTSMKKADQGRVHVKIHA